MGALAVVQRADSDDDPYRFHHRRPPYSDDHAVVVVVVVITKRSPARTNESGASQDRAMPARYDRESFPSLWYP